MESERPNFDGLLHRVKQLTNGELTQQLRQLNQQKCVRDTELLLFLSELDERALYREEAVSSLFDFCVSRLGCSEDVAYKRVGAARLMRRFPLVFDLLCTGRIHLSALMLVKPHLTQDNHREWLLTASGRSKRQVEMLVARRCPKPDGATSIRKLPTPRTPQGGEQSSGAIATPSAAPLTQHAPPPVPNAATPSAATPTAAAPLNAPYVPAPAARISVLQAETAEAPLALESCGGAAEATRLCVALPEEADHRTAAPNVVPAGRISPLSESTYRVTFTASGRWKQKLDRARELASHVISPSDLPGLLERAIDLLIEREERRRCAFGVKTRATGKYHRDTKSHADTDGRAGTDGQASTEDPPDTKHRAGTESQPRTKNHAHTQDQGDTASEAHTKCQSDAKQQPCQMHCIRDATAQDPGRVAESDVGDQTLGNRSNGPLQPTKPRSRYIPAAIRRKIWQRDEGRCTFTDAQGNRCEERCFLEIEHLEPFALNGPTTASNCTLRCRCHNALTAEWIFGRRKIDLAIGHARQQRHQGNTAMARTP